MQTVMNELRTLADEEPETHARLMEYLKGTDPAIWPSAVPYFRTILASQRQAESGNSPAAPDVGQAGTTANFPSKTREVPRRETVPTEQISLAETPSPAATDAASLPEGYPASPQNSRPDQLVTDPSEVASASVPAESTSTAIATPGPDHLPPYRAERSPLEADDWQSRLSAAIEMLESELADEPDTDQRTQRQAQLRLLYLAAGRRDDAMKPIPYVDANIQYFWSRECYGLATWMDAAREPDEAERARQARALLQEAVAKLSQSAPLVVHNLTFCRTVTGYGNITPLEKKTEFSPGQAIRLYAEVENFSSKTSEKGYHTALQSSYKILDSQGRLIDQHDFGPVEEHCRNMRRDFFTNYRFALPSSIFAGQYHLKLTIVDLNSNRTGESTIKFTVRKPSI